MANNRKPPQPHNLAVVRNDMLTLATAAIQLKWIIEDLQGTELPPTRHFKKYKTEGIMAVKIRELLDYIPLDILTEAGDKARAEAQG